MRRWSVLLPIQCKPVDLQHNRRPGTRRVSMLGPKRSHLTLGLDKDTKGRSELIVKCYLHWRYCPSLPNDQVSKRLSSIRGGGCSTYSLIAQAISICNITTWTSLCTSRRSIPAFAQHVLVDHTNPPPAPHVPIVFDPVATVPPLRPRIWSFILQVQQVPF